MANFPTNFCQMAEFLPRGGAISCRIFTGEKLRAVFISNIVTFLFDINSMLCNLMGHCVGEGPSHQNHNLG